jgi:hypothetical protein
MRSVWPHVKRPRPRRDPERCSSEASLDAMLRFATVGPCRVGESSLTDARALVGTATGTARIRPWRCRHTIRRRRAAGADGRVGAASTQGLGERREGLVLAEAADPGRHGVDGREPAPEQRKIGDRHDFRDVGACARPVARARPRWGASRAGARRRARRVALDALPVEALSTTPRASPFPGERQTCPSACVAAPSHSGETAPG